MDTGAQFIVLGEDGVVILKTIEKPALKDFSTLVKKARKESRAAGMKKSDISAAIKEARSDK